MDEVVPSLRAAPRRRLVNDITFQMQAGFGYLARFPSGQRLFCMAFRHALSGSFDSMFWSYSGVDDSRMPGKAFLHRCSTCSSRLLDREPLAGMYHAAVPHAGFLMVTVTPVSYLFPE